MTPEQNERLTRVGPGTAAGNMLRYYWWPIWFSEQVTGRQIELRILGEDLLLFRSGNGSVALIDRVCPHRGASLTLGRVEEDGIRCCYHGWKFDNQGHCLDMPVEPADTPLRKEVRLKAYPTREVAGLVFAYLGRDPVPVFPRYDILFRENMDREVGAFHEHCNWLQRAENTVDLMHSTVLHASVYPKVALQRPNVDWEDTWYGIRSSFDVPGQQTKISHMLFPASSRSNRIMRFRLPVDDVSTRTFYVRAREASGQESTVTTKGLVQRERGVYERVEDGWWGLSSREQDRAAQESQGLIADRSREFLASSDRGVVLFRRMLAKAITDVERGKDPRGVLREDQTSLLTFDTQKIVAGSDSEINAYDGYGTN